MKLNKLQYGDIVYLLGKPVSVNQALLSTNDYILIEPVPITEEFLIKNGFRMTLNKMGYKEFHLEGSSFVITKIGEFDEYQFLICHQTAYKKYVHELQQALRFIDREEFANSLKL